jgi:hypothetical protein
MMKKHHPSKIVIHHLKNHLNQIRDICDYSTTKDFINKVHFLRDECEKAIQLTNDLEDLNAQTKSAIRDSEAKVCVDVIDEIKNFFQIRHIKTSFSISENLNQFHLNLTSGIEKSCIPISEFFKRNFASDHILNLRCKVLDGNLLLAFSAELKNKSFNDFEIEMLEDFCEKNKGKVRIDRDTKTIYIRVFLPVFENCPIVENWAA